MISSIIKFSFKLILILSILFFGINILNINTTKESSWQEFNRTMLKSKEVDKIVVINSDIAQIYIKKEFLKKEKHQAVSKKSFGSSENEGPHYFFHISSPDNLEEKLEEAQLDFKEEDRIELKYSTQKGVIGKAFSWILLILLWGLFRYFYNKKLK